MLIIKVKPSVGDTVQNSIKDSIELAKRTNCVIELKFNKQTLYIESDSNFEALLKRYILWDT